MTTTKPLLIRYHMRLGDVIRCLPLARHFAQQGRTVFFECNREYHGVFDLVSYAKPIEPGAAWDEDCEVIDQQIWPARFDDFERSGLNWMDYVYAPWPSCDRSIVFDRDLKEWRGRVPEWVHDACLVFPNGYSQRNPPNPGSVVLTAIELFPGVPLCAVGKRELGCHELGSIPELVAWIAVAKHVLTVNTAPSIIASAVRHSWHHIPDLDSRHDFRHPNQIRVERRA